MVKRLEAAIAFAAMLVIGLMTAGSAAAQTGLQRALTSQMTHAGNSSSAYVVDLTSGQVLFSEAANVPRLPASVEKLYTTSTALLAYGATGHLTTTVYGTGSLAANGTWVGNLYLRGGGDPSFGSAAFDQWAYGGGTTVQQLVRNLLSASGIRAVRGSIIGDESWFDSDRGTPATKNRPNGEVEGQLSGLSFDRGFTDQTEATFQPRPALYATQQFVSALKAAGVKIPASDRVTVGITPTTAQELGSVLSPPMSTLVDWTNAPSDNFFAETLLKDLGAQYGTAGSTAAGVAVVKAELASKFGIRPAFNDGSGLSYSDHSTTMQVVALLTKMANNPDFVGSLAVAGQTGTLSEFVKSGTSAYGNCRGKTGTLQYVSNLVGYCTAANDDTLAFAFLMNSVSPDAAHVIQSQMIEDLAASKP